MTNAPQNPTPNAFGTSSLRATLQMKYNAARVNLLFAIVVTLINIVLTLCNSTFYLPFSIYVPYLLSFVGMLWCGKLPPERYGDGWENVTFLSNGFLIGVIAVGVVILAVFALLWWMSKKKSGYIIASLVLFAIDFVAMFVLPPALLGTSTFTVIDVIYHIWVAYYLIVGIRVGAQLKALPEEELIEGEFSEEAYSEEEAPASEDVTEQQEETSENLEE